MRFPMTKCESITLSITIAVGLCFSSLLTAQSEASRNKRKAPSQNDYVEYFTTISFDKSKDRLRAADDLRIKTMSSINSMLKAKKKISNEFELYLRLGELHLERSEYLRSGEVEKFTTAYDSWEIKKKGPEPKIDHSGSHSELKQGVKSFSYLVSKFPKHPRSDAALFVLGKTLARMDDAKAETYFKQLISNYPKSTYVPAVYLALGELYFDQHKITASIEAYKNSIKYKDNETYTYSIYKLGWAYFNAPAKNEQETKENQKKSLSSFKLVVSLCNKENSKRALDLKKEAVNDLVMVWADSEEIEEAWGYFSKIGEKESFYDMLERLGGIYAEQGKNEKAALVYQRLLDESPLRKNNPDIFIKLADLHFQINQPDAVAKDFTTMIVLYVNESAWRAKNIVDQKLILETSDRIKRNLHRYAALYHQKGQKYKRDGQLIAAENLYKIYLSNFPTSENAYELRFFYAEILMNFNKFDQATSEYTLVVKSQPKDGKYLKDAAFNAVMAMTKLDEAQKYPALPVAGKVDIPLKIPDVKLKLIAVIENYIKVLPAEPAGHSMRYTVAQTYFDYGHYAVALQRFTALALLIPETKQGKSAAKVVIKYHASREDWDSLIASVRGFQNSKRFKDNELILAFSDSVKMAVYQKATGFEKKKQYNKAAEQYLAFQKEFPTDKNADRALYNATLNYYNVGAIDSAISASTSLFEKYPGSPLVPDITLDIAQAYESIANFDSAADFYEKFYRRFPHDKRAPKALYNSATLYRGLKKYPKSIELLETYVNNFPTTEITGAAYYDLSGLYSKDKNGKKEIATLTQYQNSLSDKNSDEYLSISARLFCLQKDAGNAKGEKSFKSLKKELLKNHNRPLYETRKIVAESLFKEIEPEFNGFKNKLISDPKKLEKEVKAKQAALVMLADKYQSVVAIGNAEYMVASLFRIGELHEQFSADLLRVDPPKGATQIEVDGFKSSLEKVAFPLRDESYKFYEAAYVQAQEVNAFTNWTRMAYQKMTELEPEKYRPFLEKTTTPVYLEHAMKWDSKIATYIGEK